MITNTETKKVEDVKQELLKQLRKAELCQDWRSVERIEKKILQLS